MSIRTNIRSLALLLFVFAGSVNGLRAQCPPNIDFEEGTFNNWNIYTATFEQIVGGGTGGLFNVTPTFPIPGRHDIITPATQPALDQFGLFPKLCPNGSGTSVRIGALTGGRQADILTYTFTIPAGRNEFSLIYNYAMVINNAGGHPANIQPRLEVAVINITDNIVDTCSSDTIAYSNASPLPGFQTSPVNGQIIFKPWAARSVKLDGNAGKTFEITFRAMGCAATPNGSHFGYAYIDINSECSSSFIGATFCPDDAFINVTGPFGYQAYSWWNSNYTVNYGNTQTINFTPPPAPGTVLKLIVDPYQGYGCRDTLTATLQDTLTIQPQAGPDRTSCNNAPVQLGVIPKPGYVYSWSPPTGLSDPNISNPIATPSVTTQYILTVTHEGGGCVSKDTVMVYAAVLDNTIQLSGPNTFCQGDPQAATLFVQPADSIQWYNGITPIPGANQQQYIPTQSGVYHATLFSFQGSGCQVTTSDITITIYETPVAGFTVDGTTRCFKNNQFNFTNTSTLTLGAMTYEWDFGDANTANTRDASHTYAAPGTYNVRMIVSSPNGCKDTSVTTVQVYDMPAVDFSVNLVEQCFKNNQFVFTNNTTIPTGTLQYSWTFGDGGTANTRDAIHSYAAPSTNPVRLIVTSDRGCSEEKTINVTAFPTPVASFSLATAAQQCYRDNQFIFNNTSSVFAGNLLYNWDMGNGTLFNTRDVTYTYPVPGVYNVKLLITAANGGCQDSTTFAVTVYPTPKADYTINQASQCLNNNQFIFTNGSTVFTGGMQYQWDLGDGNTATTQHVTHTYANPGTYTVRLITSGTNGGCSDTISKTATVFAYPVADFLLTSPTCANTPIYVVNKTINTTTTTLDYLWEFGNGQTGNTRTPVYSYPAAGSYKVKLSVNITGCPTPVSTRELDIIVEPAIPGTRYPDFNARYNFPEVLHAQTLGNSVLWTPATNLDNRFSYNPTFKGMHDQLYTIELKNARNGCVTVDTLLVKTQKKIEIYVPTVFTPGGDGVNDLLRPLLFGFDHVNYFRVYNRWGKLLFQMNSDRPGWDGRINGQVTTETQTVVWMIEAVDVDGKTHRKQGTTVLLR